MVEQAVDWVLLLNEPSATESDFGAWQAWLNESPDHARTFSEVQDTWRRSASVARVTTDQPTPTQSKPRREARYTLRRRLFIDAAAATAAIGVLAIGIAKFISHDSKAIEQIVSTKTGEIHSMQLDDGSRIILGPQSQLAIRFAAHTRQLTMARGEAQFMVAHDSTRPFTIRTAQGSVIAVGTEFTVRSSPTRLTVSVTEGTVRCDSLIGITALTPVLLTAGHRMVLERAVIDVTTIGRSMPALGWERGHLEYQDDPLGVVIEDINRYSTTKIVLADPALAELRYSGTVFSDSLDGWLASIPKVFPVHVERRSGEYILSRDRTPQGL
jgi:transmembrane sensor